MPAKPVKIPEHFFKPKPVFVDTKTGIRVMRWNKPRSKENAKELADFFRANGISPGPNAAGQKPIEPLSREKNLKLKQLLGFGERNDIKFYKDNRNLFMLVADRPKDTRNIIWMYLYRVRQNGSPESDHYAVCSFDEVKKKIFYATLKRKLLDAGHPWGKPKRGHSGRGVLNAFADFLGDLGHTDFVVKPAEESEEAYERAGFEPPLVRGGMWRYQKSARQ